MRRNFLLLATMLLVVIQAPAQQRSTPPSGAPPYKLTATVRQIMMSITIPASDVIFGAASETPKTDKDWEKVQYSAIALAESGNLLMMPGRARDNDVWIKEAQSMMDAAALALKAAEAKNVDAVSDAGNTVYETCDSCHKKYLTAR